PTWLVLGARLGRRPGATPRPYSPPSRPLIASPLNVAAPLPSVVAVAFVSVAPAGPDASTAVTTRPAPPAGLPAASRTWITGCCAIARPHAPTPVGVLVLMPSSARTAPSV